MKYGTAPPVTRADLHRAKHLLMEIRACHDLLTNFEFDVNKPYRACLLCGVVYQSPEDRIDQPLFLEACNAQARRQLWAEKHAKLHSTKEHENLQRSGRFCTPEAAVVLVPLGIAPISDAVMSPEHEHASAVAPRAPSVDAEDHLVTRR